MRVLIVDDEAFFRVSFKSLIHWNEYGIEIVGEAEDGQEARQMIEDLKPDIVFLDITMPNLNGIEVLKILEGKDEISKVIVLSSYNDFEYVREAMKLGALDYIHKPSISQDSVITALMNAKKKLEDEKKKRKEYNNLRTEVEKNKSNLKELFLKELTYGSYKKKEEIGEKISELDVKIKDINMNFFVVTIDRYKEVKARYKNNNTHILSLAFKNIMKEVFRDEEEIEFLVYIENLYVIMKSYSKIRSRHDINRYNNLVSNNIKDALKQFLNIEATIGISNLHNNFMEVQECFSESLEANKLKFFLGHGNIIYFNDLNLKTVKDEPNFLNVLGKIRQLINEEKLEEIKNHLTEFLKELKDRKFYEENKTRDLFKNIYYLLRAKFNQLQYENPCIEGNFISIEEILEGENIIDINKIFFEVIDKLKEYTNIKNNFNIKNNKIKKAVEYINSNYDKDLSLTNIAEEIGLNKSYLSRRFKEEVGMPLMQYINKCRIKKAIKYLNNTELKNYEIAELVGYQSVEYFNTTFKKITGKSPSEVKDNL
ncbi:response regulator transcription factor [Clostridium ganghwense]|uniref:Stage 0 sporulation protein A homolog n=1 Tax=Clostridium ganghwense TaxID=312089 RepID=A0ABT4CMQ6_9CLOT|nr:response regulator [Clostridium ganghwense]MCY6369521.1 response regulator [Clostridium ganghwense]